MELERSYRELCVGEGGFIQTWLELELLKTFLDRMFFDNNF